MQPNERLPLPTHLALRQTLALGEFLQQKINAQGPMTFAEFMNHALYHPDQGYYCSPALKLGKRGDFATAPEISPIFSHCLARQCAEILKNMKDACIIELGAGHGTMAGELLTYLNQHEALNPPYFIIEISESLKTLQKSKLETNFPAVFPQISWNNEFPERRNVIILANEFLDALPCHVFKIKKQNYYEAYVTYQNNQFSFEYAPVSSVKLANAIQVIAREYLKTAESYISEINLNYDTWLDRINQSTKKSVVFLIDYGYRAHEYYHPQRKMGTLKCIYQGISNNQPLIYPGLQDITAHVDFSHLAKTAITHGFACEGFTNQAAFLMNCGLESLVKHTKLNAIDLAAQLKILTLPGEMGEIVKVMALTKNYEINLMGFQRFNYIGRL